MRDTDRQKAKAQGLTGSYLQPFAASSPVTGTVK
jgi:hypothetical protein